MSEDNLAYKELFSGELLHLVGALELLILNEISDSSPEQIHDLAEEVIDLIYQIQSHLSPISEEFCIASEMKDSLIDRVILPVGFLIKNNNRQDKQKRSLMRSAFLGEKSILKQAKKLQELVL